MKNTISIDYSASTIPTNDIVPLIKKLTPEIERISQARSAGYSSLYASINLPTDITYHAAIKNSIEEKKKLQPSMLIVIGIGGSNLGTMALQDALCGLYYNELNPKIKIYYADTVDANYISSLLQLAEQELFNNKIVLINAVTKSGTTTETIVNLELFLALLKKYYPDSYQKHVIITTDRDSILWHIAQEKKFSLLEIPKKVGGRFSVLSSVGLFPLGMLDLPIYEILAGAASMVPLATSLGEHNIAAYGAATQYAHYKKNISIQDMFVFSHQLLSLGAWYRQLVGESLGKEFDRYGNTVERGITPTVSVGTVDLHSVGQLYLGGPRDKCSTFVTVEHTKHDQKVPNYKEFEQSVANIQGKSVSSILQAIVEGVKTTYKQHQRAYISITFPELSAWCLGQFLQYKMIEIMYLGFLLEVNAFDQPNVESYKKETRRLLAQ